MQPRTTLTSELVELPEFVDALNTNFSGALPLDEYMRKTYECLSAHRFEAENTMDMIAICRDEITDLMHEEVMKYWGKTFNDCSLAGFITIGQTGLVAATNHIPIYDYVRHFTLDTMPHIAISRYGEMKKVY